MHRRVRKASLPLVAVVLATACRPDRLSTTPRPASPIARLSCDGLAAPPAVGEITYVSGGRLLASSVDGATVRCLVDAPKSGELLWGPAGDRVLLGGMQTFLVAGPRRPGGIDARSFSVSAPSGKSVVHISPDRKHLYKAAFAGGEPFEITFLTRHDEVVYHPAGTHVAAVGSLGEGEDRTYGIWLATNVGTNQRPVAEAETAERVFSLSYAADGFLAFAADHGDRFDVHWLAPSGQLEHIASVSEPVGTVVASPHGDSVAYRRGECSGDYTTRVWINRREQGLNGRLARARAEPVGWLPDGRLVVLTRESGCAGPGDLYVWATGGAQLLLATGVDRAAVRATYPPAPAPPGAPGEAAG